MQNQGFIIAREGIRWILLGAVLTGFMMVLHWTTAAWLFGGLTLFVAFFFRNPYRRTPQQKGLIIAPADGKICMITDVVERRFLNQPRKRVSIFMSVLNCHVNRSPIEGRVIGTHYHPGKFHIASHDKASDFNEQHTILMEDDRKNRFVIVQIAGFVARRIVSYIKEGDLLKCGQRFGLIQFGSRVDIYLPPQATLRAKEGQTVRGGETVIGEIL